MVLVSFWNPSYGTLRWDFVFDYLCLMIELWFDFSQITCYQPCFVGVNLKSGKYFLSLLLLAVFLNCPSDFDVSYCLIRVKVQRRASHHFFDTILHWILSSFVTIFFYSLQLSSHFQCAAYTGPFTHNAGVCNFLWSLPSRSRKCHH